MASARIVRGVDPRKLAEVAADLSQLCLDLVGIFDPTPISDGSSALISLARGRWLDAALSGMSIIPYVGDLAKAGKFPRYLKTVERAVQLAQQSADARRLLEPVMRKLGQALDLFPDGPAELQRMRRLVAEFLGATPKLARRADVSRNFRYRVYRRGDNTVKEAAGRLGVPSKVKHHRSASAQRGVSGGTGDDAGHLIGNRFGASGGAENLSPQNWRQNRGQGTFYTLEKQWSHMLEKGWGVEVRVRDFTRAGEARPWMRKVEWTEISPNGTRIKRELDFVNTHTPKSRQARGIESQMPPGHQARIYDLEAYRRQRGR